jgi:hypothetical protein
MKKKQRCGYPYRANLECTEETSEQYLDIGGHSGLEK